MITTATISLWNKFVGVVAWDPLAAVATFEFAPEMRSSGWDVAPLQMPLTSPGGRVFSFPALRNNATFRGLPGLLADALPDKYGTALIDTWLAQQGRRPGGLNPVETLCFIGSRSMGALEFRPALLDSATQVSRIELAGVIEISEQILTRRRDFSTQLATGEEAALLDVLKIGTSAGGGRAKAIVAYNPATGEVRSGQAAAPPGFAHWLIKFDGVTDQQFGSSAGYGRVEMAYHRMALAAGITMAECRLLEENGRAHFMTRRFDREGSTGKLHVQTFCALQHLDFNEVTLYSYEQLFATMRALGLPYPQAEQLYRRMAFNVMARNCDDHTKNFAFIMNPAGAWSLSPAYDVCHAYRPGSAWVSQHALSVNGKRTDIGRDDLLAVAARMNIKKPAGILAEIADVVRSWPAYADTVQVPPELRDAIGRTLRPV